jgi:membrane metallo-endopeptidase-like protein 1
VRVSFLSFSSLFARDVSIQSDFTSYLRRLYLLGNVTLNRTDIVTVKAPELLRDVSSIIDRQSPRTIQNYMIWRFMMTRISSMPKQFREIVKQFSQASHGTSIELARSIQCATYVNDKMGFAVSKLYIHQYFDKNARNQVLAMIIDDRCLSLIL